MLINASYADDEVQENLVGLDKRFSVCPLYKNNQLEIMFHCGDYLDISAIKINCMMETPNNYTKQDIINMSDLIWHEGVYSALTCRASHPFFTELPYKGNKEPAELEILLCSIKGSFNKKTNRLEMWICLDLDLVENRFCYQGKITKFHEDNRFLILDNFYNQLSNCIEKISMKQAFENEVDVLFYVNKNGRDRELMRLISKDQKHINILRSYFES